MIEICRNYADQWEFEIRANNGRTLAMSYNGYESKRACLNAINSIMKIFGVDKITRNLMIKGVKEIERRKHVR